MIKTQNRRQFLQGAAGFTLALPILDSLFGKGADAGEFPYATNPRFVCMVTDHGGVYPEYMWPSEATCTNATQMAPGHDVHWGPLQREVVGNTARLSDVVQGPANLLTDTLASKMMLVRGLDVPFRLSHNTGGALGNFARSDNNNEFNIAPRPTIDQVMAWSDSFYPDLPNILMRSMHIGRGGDRALSWNYSNPASETGAIEAMPSTNGSMALFNQIFVPPADPGEPQRPPVVDRVFESYTRLRNGNFGHASRLSTADRSKLDDHLERIFELERKLNAVASCGDMSAPTSEAEDYANGSASQDPAELATKFQLYNDVIVAAFICGTSRLATVHPVRNWHTDLANAWHQDVAHQAQYDPAMEQLLVASHGTFFQSVFLDLVSKLDVEEANGQTFLDNTLVMWTQECGEVTHHPVSLPVVTAGSAAGYFNTGRCYDYRNRTNTALMPNSNGMGEVWMGARPGVLYQQWLANILMSMNVMPSEFEHPGERGYGDPYRADQHSQSDVTQSHPDYLFDQASEPLPFMVS